MSRMRRFKITPITSLRGVRVTSTTVRAKLASVTIGRATSTMLAGSAAGAEPAWKAGRSASTDAQRASIPHRRQPYLAHPGLTIDIAPDYLVIYVP